MKYDIKLVFKESYKYLFQKENENLKLVSGLRSFIIIERLIAVPLYIYISLNDLKTFTILYVISTIVELLSLFIAGNNYDKNKIKTFIKAIVTSVFLFAHKVYILMLNKSIYNLVDDVYDSSYSALSQSKCEMEEKDTLLLSIIHEMCLCFFEFIVLFALLIISIINVNITFKVMFAGSIIVLFINAKIIKQWNV